ncbi:MAG: hypothetical protein ACRDMH_01145 [Solirubrobacterales bacterium]
MQNEGVLQERIGLVLLWSVPAVLFAAATFELVLLVGLVSYHGGQSGDGISGERAVAGVAALAMLVGAALAGVHATRPWRPSAVALFAPAAAAFMVTRFYTYDPYYLPTLRRYSDGGAISPTWILTLLAVSIGVGVLTRLSPRLGSLATALTLLLVLVTFTLASDGH